MIYSSEAQFLIVILKNASEAEGVAIGNLLSAMKSGVKDHAVLGVPDRCNGTDALSQDGYLGSTSGIQTGQVIQYLVQGPD